MWSNKFGNIEIIRIVVNPVKWFDEMVNILIIDVFPVISLKSGFLLIELKIGDEEWYHVRVVDLTRVWTSVVIELVVITGTTYSKELSMVLWESE